MILRKIPLRKCLATGEQLPKKEMIRVVRNKEGEVFVDPTGKMNGRGAYLKRSKAAFETAKKKKVLARALQVEIPEQIFEELEKYNPLKVEPLKGMIEHQEIFTEIDDVNKINPYYLKGHGRE